MHYPEAPSFLILSLHYYCCHSIPFNEPQCIDIDSIDSIMLVGSHDDEDDDDVGVQLIYLFLMASNHY